MVLLVFIHGYNVSNDPLFATSNIDEPLTITNFIEYFIANGLLRFRIPLLMLISGYLIAYKQDASYLQLIKKKVKTLIVPYVLFSTITILLMALVEQLFMTTNTDGLWGKKISTYSIHDFFYRIVISPIPFQLWFLRILFLFIVGYPVIKYCLQKAPIPFLIVLFILRAVFNSDHYTLVFYFAAGIYLQLQKINIDAKPTFFNTNLWLCIVLVLVTIKTLVAFGGKPYFGKYTSFILEILHLAHVIPSVFIAWFGLDKLVNYCMKQRWFVAIMGSSFFIFACHEPLMVMLIKPYVTLLGGGETAKLIAFFTLPIAMLILCISFDALVSKASPWFYNFLTGNRGSIKKRIKL
jgi:fucose 4-O-acetylase-like acetyltransferase